MTSRPPTSSSPLWPLPLAITLLFLFSVHLAYALSIHEHRVPACVPYWEGCVSISRAAHHGLGNLLFRLFVIPCAMLHAVVWWLSARWLRGADRQARWMCGLGITSAFALAVYAAFLGTEGEVYGFLRRYGVTVYFGFGFLAQLLLMRAAWRRELIAPALLRVMAALCAWMLLLGIGNLIAGAVVEDATIKDRIENALEWQLGLLLVGWFALLSIAWKRANLRLTLL